MDSHLKKLDYVISAVGMTGVLAPKHDLHWFDQYKKTTVGLTNDLKNRIRESCNHTDPVVSILYNAYTEKNHVEGFQRLNNIGSDAVYADSGGLQMVTAGKTITTEIKDQIYKTQAYADYAMCFDVIPLISTSTKRTRNERSNVGNKIFMDEKHPASAIATGLNVKAQSSYFRSIGAKTKVIIIVQGNNYNDMVEFYKNIESVLEPEDYENIGGMAIADTCMGNGELESIEMLRAAKIISGFCHENVKKHLHVLGVGSISRMKPILYLLKSKYLDAFERVSYDSSSHTSTFQYGLLKLNGTCKSIGTYRTPAVDTHFRNVYNLFENTFSQYLTQDEFLDNVFHHDKDWKFSTIKDRALEINDPRLSIPMILVNVAHTYFQIHNFVSNLDIVIQDEYHVFKTDKVKPKDKAINFLLNVKNENDMSDWFANYRNVVDSKKIKRNSDFKKIEEFHNE